MPKLSAADHEAWLRSRFKIALAFAQGDLSCWEYGAAATALKISMKTLQRDIQRALKQTTFGEWRPRKRGPPKGERRVAPGVFLNIGVTAIFGDQTGFDMGKLVELLNGRSADDAQGSATVPPSLLDFKA